MGFFYFHDTYAYYFNDNMTINETKQPLKPLKYVKNIYDFLSKKFLLIVINLLIVLFTNAQSQKIEVVDYSFSPRKSHISSTNFNDCFISEKLFGDTLQIRILTSGHRNRIHSPKTKFVNDTLWISYVEGRKSKQNSSSIFDTLPYVESYCSCKRSFELSFVFKGIDRIPKGVFISSGIKPHAIVRDCWNNYVKRGKNDFYKFIGDKFDIIDGDTVNFVDKFGKKQGLWIKMPNLTYEDELIIKIELEPEDEDFEERERLNDSYRCYFVNDEIKTGEIIEYYQPFSIKKYHKVYMDFNTYKETFYDLDGNVTKVNERSPKK